MEYNKETIEKYLNYSVKDLTDAGICPSCFDKATGGKVFGDCSNMFLFEDDDIVCQFVGNPRADGHAMIMTKEHFHDMLEAPDWINEKIVRFAKKLMNLIVEIFSCERVYFCTMCDGPMNHYHIQLIPRYSFEERGSKNFVKARKQYVYDEAKTNTIREALKKYSLDDKKKCS